jgi:hypothetical protein
MLTILIENAKILITCVNINTCRGEKKNFMNIWILSKKQDDEKSLKVFEQLLKMGHNVEMDFSTDANELKDIYKKSQRHSHYVNLMDQFQKEKRKHYKNMINTTDSILVMNYNGDSIEDYIGAYNIENNIDNLTNVNIFNYTKTKKTSIYYEVLDQIELEEEIELINFVSLKEKPKSLFKKLFSRV